jgi:hypothetical protein
MKNTAALPTLESVLRNKSEDPMVRHEVRTVFPEAKCPLIMSQPRQPKQWVPSQMHHPSQFLKNFSTIPKETSEKLVRSLLLKSNGIIQRKDKNIFRIPTNPRYRKYHFCVSFPTNPYLDYMFPLIPRRQLLVCSLAHRNPTICRKLVSNFYTRI